MLRLVPLCLVLSCATPSAKRPFDRLCMDAYARDHCDRGQRDEIERSFRVPPAEFLAKQGWQGVRVFMVDGYSNDMPLLTVLHRRSGPQALEVRGPSRDVRTLEATPGPELEAAARTLLASTAASPVAPPEVSDGSVCLHAWVAYIEVLDGGRAPVASATPVRTSLCSSRPTSSRPWHSPGFPTVGSSTRRTTATTPRGWKPVSS